MYNILQPLKFYVENYKCFQHQATNDGQLNMKLKNLRKSCKFVAVSRDYKGRRRNHRVKSESVGLYLTLGTMDLTLVGKTNK